MPPNLETVEEIVIKGIHYLDVLNIFDSRLNDDPNNRTYHIVNRGGITVVIKDPVLMQGEIARGIPVHQPKSLEDFRYKIRRTSAFPQDAWSDLVNEIRARGFIYGSDVTDSRPGPFSP